MSKKYVTVRYEEFNGRFVVAAYPYDITVARFWVPSRVAALSSKIEVTGAFHDIKDRPEWLTDIVNAAWVGGLAVTTENEPPYDIVVWFYLDKDGELVGFLNVNEEE